jgi:hypothetical protein
VSHEEIVDALWFERQEDGTWDGFIKHKDGRVTRLHNVTPLSYEVEPIESEVMTVESIDIKADVTVKGPSQPVSREVREWIKKVLG